MMLTQVDEIPRQLREGTWKVTCAWSSGKTDTIAYDGFEKAYTQGWKRRLQPSRSASLREMYLSVMTSDGEQIFGTAFKSKEGG